MVRRGPHLEQERAVAKEQVGVAVDRKLLAVHVLLPIGHGIDRSTALGLEGSRDLLSEEFGHLHQEGVGLRDPHRHGHRRVLARESFLDPRHRLGRRMRSDGEGRLAIDGVSGLLERSSSRIGPVVTIVRRVEAIRDIRENRVGNREFLKNSLILAVVARVGIEARQEVQLPRAAALNRLPLGKGLEDRNQHRVIAMDVGPAEGRRVGVTDRQVLGHVALLTRVLDEGGQVVSDHLGHTGGEDRDHLRFVQRDGVLEPLVEVVLPAEHRTVFGHG